LLILFNFIRYPYRFRIKKTTNYTQFINNKLNFFVMNLTKFIIVITFVTSILIISSSQISFAIKNDKEENDGKDLKKDIPVSSIEKTKKTDKDSKEKTQVQNDILNDHYPNQYYVCGYPQQLVTDYNSFEKVNCN
jgi:hypothetical protein